MSYTSLDLLVQFATDNNILDLNYVPANPQSFFYNTNLVQDGKINNYVYTTAVTPNSGGRYHDAYFDPYHD